MAKAAFNMSEAFLYILFQESNVVSLEGEHCGICLEEYNTLSRETGMIEAAIRLPCNHVIGSACIATWLKDTNTCPICRREFFQAQPRPNLEHGIIDGPDNENEGDQRETSAIIEDFCDHLGLGAITRRISEHLVAKLAESALLDERHSNWCVIAVGIYIVSHIVRRPRSPREIADITGLGAGHLREAYDIVYPEREELIDLSLSILLDEVFDETGPLNWPAPGNEVTDMEIESRRDLPILRERCEQGCNELGLGPAIAGLTTRIATRFLTANLVIDISIRETAAASIFMASHMMRHSLGFRRLAEVLRMNESRVRDAYRGTYNYRVLLTREPQLKAPEPRA